MEVPGGLFLGWFRGRPPSIGKKAGGIVITANLFSLRRLRKCVLGGAILIGIALPGLNHAWDRREKESQTRRLIAGRKAEERVIASGLRAQQIPKRIIADKTPPKEKEW